MRSGRELRSHIRIGGQRSLKTQPSLQMRLRSECKVRFPGEKIRQSLAVVNIQRKLLSWKRIPLQKWYALTFQMVSLFIAVCGSTGHWETADVPAEQTDSGCSRVFKTGRKLIGKAGSATRDRTIKKEWEKRWRDESRRQIKQLRGFGKWRPKEITQMEKRSCYPGPVGVPDWTPQRGTRLTSQGPQFQAVFL